MNSALNDLLRATSRSFYLTLRVLPGTIRPQIGLAYLLARTTDTIADTEILPVAQRLNALQKLRERILRQSSAALNFGELAQNQNSSAERQLLERVEESLAVLQNFPDADQKLICAVLDVITSGQELDLQRFASTNGQNIVALKTDAELDDYTYRVAGCVGEFWTKMCRAHLFPNARLDENQFIADGVCFGKGLQLVNILRDLPKDLQNGRCYLPLEKLAEIHLSPTDLLNPANEDRLKPVYHHYLNLAESYLSIGWRYTNTLPFLQIRVRLACAWPILIGAKTTARLRAGGWLDSQQRVKISRAEVRGILIRSLLACPFPSVWRNLHSPSGKAVASSEKLA